MWRGFDRLWEGFPEEAPFHLEFWRMDGILWEKGSRQVLWRAFQSEGWMCDKLLGLKEYWESRIKNNSSYITEVLLYTGCCSEDFKWISSSWQLCEMAYYSHFIDDVSKAWRSEVTCPTVTRKGQSWYLHLGSSAGSCCASHKIAVDSNLHSKEENSQTV